MKKLPGGPGGFYSPGPVIFSGRTTMAYNPPRQRIFALIIAPPIASRCVSVSVIRRHAGSGRYVPKVRPDRNCGMVTSVWQDSAPPEIARDLTKIAEASP
ncbi:MAG: hypothetical protein OXU71_08340 [Gammaproteobacteria bacterium]|nr:hypothetical protein [Gammaproteobacteria bacterium]